jgi:hypothetical protein
MPRHSLFPPIHHLDSGGGSGGGVKLSVLISGMSAANPADERRQKALTEYRRKLLEKKEMQAKVKQCAL